MLLVKHSTLIFVTDPVLRFALFALSFAAVVATVSLLVLWLVLLHYFSICAVAGIICPVISTNLSNYPCALKC